MRPQSPSTSFRRLLLLCATLAAGTTSAACDAVNNNMADTAPKAQQTSREVTTVKIRLTARGRSYDATLVDTAAGRDLASQLPLRLTFSDYNSAEKIAHLPKSLSSEGAPAGADPAPGDIAYYAPWGNFVIYYGDVGYWPGIVPLGKIQADPETLRSLEGPVVIEAGR